MVHSALAAIGIYVAWLHRPFPLFPKLQCKFLTEGFSSLNFDVGGRTRVHNTTPAKGHTGVPAKRAVISSDRLSGEFLVIKR